MSTMVSVFDGLHQRLTASEISNDLKIRNIVIMCFNKSIIIMLCKLEQLAAYLHLFFKKMSKGKLTENVTLLIL